MGKGNRPAGIGMTPSTTELGRFIRERRLELGIRQVPLAKSCGLAESLISQCEVGERKRLKPHQVAVLAKALQCGENELTSRMQIKECRLPVTELGRLIRIRREELGMTIGAFAEKMKVSVYRASELEIGKAKFRSYKVLKLLSEVLGFEYSSLAKFNFHCRRLKYSSSDLGSLIRARRIELSISSTELARRCSISHQYISLIELGKVSLAESDELVLKLAEILGIDPAEIKETVPKRKIYQRRQKLSGLGCFVSELRVRLGLSLKDLSKKSGLSLETVRQIELNRNIRPRISTLEKLEKAIGTEIPAEFLTTPVENKEKVQIIVTLKDSDLNDLKKLREIARFSTNVAVVRRALKVLRHLLENQEAAPLI